MGEHERPQEPIAEEQPPITWAVEQVSPTGQQVERIRDGLSIVFELLARRYRREHGLGNPPHAGQESP
ncbi:MAG TPA: hypothetical protein P5118_18975 [Planctomycetota bacterium]|nr:hypothetical protein [Planctomycetota bacterium]